MPADLLFVYGTLRPGAGGAGAERLARESRQVGAAWVRGELLAVGRYPGLVPGTGEVRGELVRLGSPASTLAWLDDYEGALFRRERRTVRLAGGGCVEAWCYRYTGPATGLSRITGGDFLASGQRHS